MALKDKIKSEGKMLSFNKIKKRDNARKAGDIVKSILIRAAVCILILMVFSVIYQNRYDLSYKGFTSWIGDRAALNGRGEGFPVNVKGNTTKNLKYFNETIVSLTDTAVASFNETGKTVSEKQHGYSSPVIETGKRYAILYDMGSKSYRIESVSTTVFSGKTDNRILMADIGETGEAAICEISGENEMMITLIDKYGKKKLRRTTHEYKPVDLSVMPDGSGVASIGIKAKDGGITSIVEVFASNKKDGAKELYRLEDASNMYLSVEFLSSHEIMIIGDSALSVIDINSKKKTDYTYSGRRHAGFYSQYDVGSGIMLSDYSDRKECSMIVFGKNGLKVSETQTGKQMNMITRDGKYICFTGDNKLYKYKVNGEFVAEQTIDTDVSGICMLAGEVYVSGTSTIQRIDI